MLPCSMSSSIMLIIMLQWSAIMLITMTIEFNGVELCKVSMGPNLPPQEIAVLESENRLEWESNNFTHYHRAIFVTGWNIQLTWTNIAALLLLFTIINFPDLYCSIMLTLETVSIMLKIMPKAYHVYARE